MRVCVWVEGGGGPPGRQEAQTDSLPPLPGLQELLWGATLSSLCGL